jgi:hypothetical protein
MGVYVGLRLFKISKKNLKIKSRKKVKKNFKEKFRKIFKKFKRTSRK